MSRTSATLSHVRTLFAESPGTIYLDTAAYGLPPRSTVEVMTRSLGAWERGEAEWIEDWDRPADTSRGYFASVIGADPAEIALVPSASVAVGLIAASLSAGDEVLVSSDEFTSMLFPLLVAQERGTRVRQVAFEEIAGSIRPETTLVALSLVQMQSGKSADLAGICEAAKRNRARVLVDGTQGIPFFSLAPVIGEVDYLVCAAFKHLLCPRGVAFLYVRRDHWIDLPPLNANWRAADEPYGRFFGGPLTLANDARRFDVSLSWLPWLGATESLRLLMEWQSRGLLDEVLRLAQILADRLHVTWEGASLVCAPIEDGERAARALRAEGIRASVRGSNLRFSVHVYNSEAEILHAAEAIRPFIVQ